MHGIASALSLALALGAPPAAPPAARADQAVTIAQSSSAPEITGILARPAGPGPFPAVLVLHGCAGLGPLEHVVVAGLAREGFVALAIDTLKPQGVTNACEGAVKGAIRISAGYAAASLAWLAAQPDVRANELGVVGYSMGAIEILDLIDPFAAHAPPPGLRAAVAYYPACRARDGASTTLPLLILDGDADDWTPSGPCQDLAKAAIAAGKTVEITTYPGATHNFNTPRDHDVVYLGHHIHYDQAAADDAREKTNAFLHRFLR
jgi:dienelactone hydrolase